MIACKITATDHNEIWLTALCPEAYQHIKNFTKIDPKPFKQSAIGIASYGAPEHVSSLDFLLFNFSDHLIHSFLACTTMSV